MEDCFLLGLFGCFCLCVLQKIHRHGFYRQGQDSNLGLGEFLFLLHVVYVFFSMENLCIYWIISVIWSPVIWWLCELHGSGCWNWTLQMWNSCRPGCQVGILWFVHLPAFIHKCTAGTLTWKSTSLLGSEIWWLWKTLAWNLIWDLSNYKI